VVSMTYWNGTQQAVKKFLLITLTSFDGQQGLQTQSLSAQFYKHFTRVFYSCIQISFDGILTYDVVGIVTVQYRWLLLKRLWLLLSRRYNSDCEKSYFSSCTDCGDSQLLQWLCMPLQKL